MTWLTHAVCVCVCMQYGHNLASQKRYEQALSVFAKNFRMCKEAMGARTLRVNHIQVGAFFKRQVFA